MAHKTHYLLIEVTFDREMPDLTDLVAGRIWSMPGRVGDLPATLVDEKSAKALLAYDATKLEAVHPGAAICR